MTTSKGWLGDWEDETEERQRGLVVEPERPKPGEFTNDPRSTVRGLYRQFAPADCPHPLERRLRDAARDVTACDACGLEVTALSAVLGVPR